MVRLKFWKKKKPLLDNTVIQDSLDPRGGEEGEPSQSPEEDEGSYDVSECIEKTGFGSYQYKVILIMGLMSFADASEIWLSAIIISK